MRILCIDPSLTATGLVVYDLRAEAWTEAEVIRTEPIAGLLKFKSHRIRAGNIQAGTKRFVLCHEPQLALVECWKMSGTNSKSAAAMSIAWAVVTATLDTLEVSQLHIQPETAKAACCGSRKATKTAVAAHLAERWPHLARLAREASANATRARKPSTKHAEHVYDAAALFVAAETGEHRDRIRLLRSLVK